MATVLELYEQLSEICRNLNDQSAVLAAVNTKIETYEVVTAEVMSQTSRVDVQQAAISGIHGAYEQVRDAIALLSHTQELLDTYKSTL